MIALLANRLRVSPHPYRHLGSTRTLAETAAILIPSEAFL